MSNCVASDGGGPGNPLGRRVLGKAVVSWMKDGIAAMVREVACAEERGDIKEAEERMGTGHNLVALAQPFLLARPMPQGLEPLCLRASLHYPTIFDHYQRELRVALQASQVYGSQFSCNGIDFHPQKFLQRPWLHCKWNPNFSDETKRSYLGLVRWDRRNFSLIFFPIRNYLNATRNNILTLQCPNGRIHLHRS